MSRKRFEDGDQIAAEGGEKGLAVEPQETCAAHACRRRGIFELKVTNGAILAWTMAYVVVNKLTAAGCGRSDWADPLGVRRPGRKRGGCAMRGTSGANSRSTGGPASAGRPCRTRGAGTDRY